MVGHRRRRHTRGQPDIRRRRMDDMRGNANPVVTRESWAHPTRVDRAPKWRCTPLTCGSVTPGAAAMSGGMIEGRTRLSPRRSGFQP